MPSTLVASMEAVTAGAANGVLRSERTRGFVLRVMPGADSKYGPSCRGCIFFRWRSGYAANLG